MTDVRVIWAKWMPDEIRNALEPIVNKHLSKLPDWCRTLNVSHSSDNTRSMSVETAYRYRRCNMWVHNDWLMLSKISREEAVVHEFSHGILAPISEFTKRLIDTLKSQDLDELFISVLESEFEEAMEATTQDLTISLKK